MSKYYCKLSKKHLDSDTKLTKHINSNKYIKLVNEFRESLEKLKPNKLVKKYGTDNIDKIIKLQIEKIDTDDEILYDDDIEEYELKLQRKSNKVIFEFNDKELQEHKDYEEFKNKFKNKLKSWHNTLSGAGVTGDPALDDIMNIIMLCYLDKHISEKGQFDLLNLDSYPIIKRNRFEKFNYFDCLKINYMIKNKHFLVKSNDKNDGKSILEKIGEILSNHKTMSKIIKDNNFINCKKDKILHKLISDINDFCNKYHIFKYSDIVGIAYEFWMNEYRGGGGKELGNFFTERKLMRMCFELIDKKDIKNLNIDNNSTIGDEYCGTFGFPLYLKSFLKDKFNIDIKNKNIYGVEFEDRASRMALMNAMFSLDNIDNISRGDSFITNVSPHLDISVHNVPFGGRMKYKHIKEHYEEYKINNSDIPDFDDIMKSKANQDAILSSQMVIYKTTKIGICIIKDGQEATGTTKELIRYRKHFCDSVNLKKILKIPSGSFSSTGTKTLCLYFIKDGNKTDNIQFLELDNESHKIIELCNVKYKDLENNKYLWSPNTYLEDEEFLKLTEKTTCKWVKFGDIFELIKGKIQSSKIIDGTEILFVSKNKNENMKYIDSKEFYNGGLFIANAFNGNGKCPIRYTNSKCIHSDLMLKINPKININEKYYFYYLKSINRHIEENFHKGSCNLSLNKPEFYKMKIPLPSLEKQNEIVEKIETLDNLMKLMEEQNEEHKKAMKIYLDMMMKKYSDSIKWKKLGDVCEINYGERIVKKKIESGEYNVYGGGDKTFKINKHNREGLSCKISRFGASEKNFIQIINEKYWLNDSGFTIDSKNNKMNSRYLFYYLLNFNNDSNIFKKLFHGGGQQNIKMDIFKKLEIPLPSLEIQKEIVEFIESIDNIISRNSVMIENYKKITNDILKQSYCD